MKAFVYGEDASTKNQQTRSKSSSVDVTAYAIDGKWSVDSAYVDKQARNNNGLQYLHVAVDVLPRCLRILPKQKKFIARNSKTFHVYG